tara:strand:+ start:1037 stop:2218 length:1182 start_codon:yes stop_codon:yes gene_type:complete
MTGYVRQSSADIVATAVVRANPLNTEFNTLRDAFAFHSSGTTGHKHDGSSSEGSYVPLIADLDALNKVAVDTSNNRVGVFVEVSNAAVEQLRISDGLITPVTDNDIDLGQSTVEFKDLYLDGTAHIDTLDVDENATIDGNTIIGAAATNTVAINAKISTALIPTADSSFDLGSSSAYWKDSYIDSVTTTGNVTIGGNVTVNGTADFTNTTLNNVTDPSSAQQAATKNYVDTAINNLIAGAPATLDTLDEIAAAINDDDNVYTTLTNSIATKLSLSGGSMTGAIAMGGSKITGAGSPITGSDLTNKTYVDGILGSATAAADSAADAQKLAINPEDSQYTLSDSSTTGFSALHYATKSADTYQNLVSLAAVVGATVADYGFINNSPTSTADYGAL